MDDKKSKMNQQTKYLFKTIFLNVLIVFLISVTVSAQKISTRKIKKMIEKSEILQEHLVGFALYNQDKNKMIFNYNANKHFIPASNIKMYTLYTCLEMLGDSVPALKYVTKGDSLIFWGTGDPSLSYANFKSEKIYDFLKTTTKKLFFVSTNYSGNFYGAGWAYGDYNRYYQPEITPFPIEGNLAKITYNNDSLKVKPTVLTQYFSSDKNLNPGNFSVQRSLEMNKFTYPTSTPTVDFYQEIPFKTSPDLTIAILKEKINKEITPIHYLLPQNASVIYSEKTDEVLSAMMLPSDNFIAEQLLLVCASTLSNNLNTASIIAYSKQHFMEEFSKNIKWVDGSGLSRYNLLTPNSSVELLKKIKDKVNNEARLHSFFPAGGVSGTLKNVYKTDNGEAFIWAKTGTLSNNHSQSGYLITKKGKRLIFSFMHNNFIKPTADIRNEIVRIMTEIHNEF